MAVASAKKDLDGDSADEKDSKRRRLQYYTASDDSDGTPLDENSIKDKGGWWYFPESRTGCEFGYGPHNASLTHYNRHK